MRENLRKLIFWDTAFALMVILAFYLNGPAFISFVIAVIAVASVASMPGWLNFNPGAIGETYSIMSLVIFAVPVVIYFTVLLLRGG